MGAVAKPTFGPIRTMRRSPDAAWIVAGRSTLTNDLLVGAFHESGVRAKVVRPSELSGLARTGDVVLGRLDVRRTLDGVEDGIWELRRVERRGLRVLNPAPSLLACHDKLQTAVRLAAAGIAHPKTLTLTGSAPRANSTLPSSSSRGSAAGGRMSSYVILGQSWSAACGACVTNRGSKTRAPSWRRTFRLSGTTSASWWPAARLSAPYKGWLRPASGGRMSRSVQYACRSHHRRRPARSLRRQPP
jgi:hypothetical protein